MVKARDGWFKWKTDFFRFYFHTLKLHKFFYETKIIWFSAITTEWSYPRKYWWKRLSDFNKIKFYLHLYHCKRKRLNKKMIKTFNWLFLGNKYEIYLFTKEMKKKKKRQIWHLGIFHIREYFQKEKTGNRHDVWNFICFS